MEKNLTTQIFLNPRINKEAIQDFDINIMKAKHKGIKVDRCKMFRAMVDKFNDNPDKVLKYLGINK